jgi:transposase
MCPYRYYNVMRTSKDPKQIRYQMVLSVDRVGIKQTARDFHTSRTTVRKWLRRWMDEGYAGLQERSRRPRHSPLATPPEERERLVALKSKYKRLGADQIRIIEGLDLSARTIRKIWRQEGVSSRKRRRKSRTKQNLREVKRQWDLFQQVAEDTKDLWDIPEYYLQMKSLGLPTIQYTARDVTTGLLFMGFAQERSLTNSVLFGDYLNEELDRYGADLSRTIRQTDNGSEYIGSVTAKEPSAYTKMIEKVSGQEHKTIPPGAYTYQADVETVHNLVEMEFYELESFTSRDDFLRKARTYQMAFNLLRPNSYKEGKTPWQLAKEKKPDLPIDLAMIPPVFIEHLMDKTPSLMLQGGHDVPSTPYFPPHNGSFRAASPDATFPTDLSSGFHPRRWPGMCSVASPCATGPCG